MGPAVSVSGAISLTLMTLPHQLNHADETGVAGGGRALCTNHGRARDRSHSIELEVVCRLVAVGRPEVAGAELQDSRGGGGARL